MIDTFSYVLIQDDDYSQAFLSEGRPDVGLISEEDKKTEKRI